MTLLHLPCGKPMVQLTPVIGGMPAPEQSVAWCLHCADETPARPGGEPDRAEALVGSEGTGAGSSASGLESQLATDRVMQSAGPCSPGGAA